MQELEISLANSYYYIYYANQKFYWQRAADIRCYFCQYRYYRIEEGCQSETAEKSEDTGKQTAGTVN